MVKGQRLVSLMACVRGLVKCGGKIVEASLVVYFDHTTNNSFAYLRYKNKYIERSIRETSCLNKTVRG